MEKSQKHSTIEVKITGLGSFTVNKGVTLGDVSRIAQQQWPYLIVGGIIKNVLRDLEYVLEDACEVELVDTSSDNGLRIYNRSLTFLLIKACHDLYPEKKIMIKHTLGNGLYCEFTNSECTEGEIEKISRRMREIVAADLPLTRKLLSKAEACELLLRQNQEDTVKLLQYRDKVNVHVNQLDGFYEYFYGYMVNRTGMLDRFRLIHYPPGMVLQTPSQEDQEARTEYQPKPKLANVYQEAKAWADTLQVPHLAALNEIIERGCYADIIRVNEALHEKKIAYIADMICSDPAIRVVLIAGPSSSGKTTFAQRLLIQLRVNGRKPVSISLDNYFIDKELTPRDEDGDYDFEAIEALKLDLFNDHLSRLIKGEEVEMPVYNFKKGTAEPHGILVKVPPGEPIIIEGIHGLNDRLTWSIPAEQKFKIYISLLTQLNIDNTNRIPTTDSRLLRRIIRDSRTRGYDALNTIKRWPSVRRGEDKNIFPFQENADVMFNSSLVYELAVLKPFLEPLLMEVGPEHREHVEARRLLKFLSYFRPIPVSPIPPNSILREFVGGSWFKA